MQNYFKQNSNKRKNTKTKNWENEHEKKLNLIVYNKLTNYSLCEHNDEKRKNKPKIKTNIMLTKQFIQNIKL